MSTLPLVELDDSKSQKEFNSVVKIYSRIGSIIIIFLSIVVLLGWFFNLPLFKSILPVFSAMNPLEALIYILCAVSLLIRTNDSFQEKLRNIITIVFCIPIISVGIVTVIGYLLNTNLGIDQIFFSESLNGNRIAPNTGFNLILIGISIFLLKKHTKPLFKISQSITLLAGVITMFAMVGYLYNTLNLYTILKFSPMPLNSTLAFTLLCASILLSTPNHGVVKTLANQSKISSLARFLFSISLLIPLFVGFLILIGLNLNIFTPNTGIAIFVVIHIIIFTSLVWWNAHILFKDDIKKNELNEKLKERTLELEETEKKLENKVTELENAKEKISELLNHESKLKDLLDDNN